MQSVNFIFPDTLETHLVISVLCKRRTVFISVLKAKLILHIYFSGQPFIPLYNAIYTLKVYDEM